MTNKTVLKSLIWPLTMVCLAIILKQPLLGLIEKTKTSGTDYSQVALKDSVELYDFILASQLDQRFLAFDIPQARSNFLVSGKRECSAYVLYDNEGIGLDDRALFSKISNINSLIRRSILCGQFKGLIVVDEKGQYIGSFDRDYFLESVIYWGSYADFVAQKTIKAELSWLRKNIYYAPALMYPKNMLDQGEGSIFYLNDSDSVQTAITKMLSNDLNFAPVLNARHQVVGLLTKETLVTRLLLDRFKNDDSSLDR